jgi:CelD/BcsL family acetyltransferase involved in cellulose biosynthesis
MKWAIEQGYRRVNLSIGEDVSKTRWGPLEVRYQEVQCVRNAGWRIAMARGMNAVRSARRKLRAKSLQNNEILPVA